MSSLSGSQVGMGGYQLRGKVNLVPGHVVYS